MTSRSLQKVDWDASLVNLVDVLEKGTQDLTAIEARAEIANTYTVSLIEGKLPRRTLTKWLGKESSTAGKNIFDEML